MKTAYKYIFAGMILVAGNLSAMDKNKLQSEIEHKIRADKALAPLASQPAYSNKVLSIASMLFSPIRAGYNWVNGPDKTMPTLRTLQVVSFLPVKDPATIDIDKALTKKEEIVATLKKPYKSELLAMFLPSFKSDEKPINETILINDTFYRVQSGIPKDIKDCEQVTIRAGGCYDPKAYSTYVALKAGNQQGACVAFSFPTSTRRAFNYGQEQDTACIDIIYDELLRMNPKARIALYGTCKGGANILRFLAENSEKSKDLSNVKAAMMESPTISVKRAISQYPIYPFVGLVFPNHKSDGKTILDAKKMPAHVPIFIGRLKNDTVSKFEDTNELVGHLNKVGSQGKTYLMTTKESSIIHGQLGRAQDFQAGINAFYKVHGMAHRPLAQGEEALLKQASEEAASAQRSH